MFNAKNLLNNLIDKYKENLLYKKNIFVKVLRKNNIISLETINTFFWRN